MSAHACAGSCVVAWLLQYRNASGGLSTYYRSGPHMEEADALTAATTYIRANFVAAYRCGVIV